MAIKQPKSGPRGSRRPTTNESIATREYRFRIGDTLKAIVPSMVLGGALATGAGYIGEEAYHHYIDNPHKNSAAVVEDKSWYEEAKKTVSGAIRGKIAKTEIGKSITIVEKMNFAADKSAFWLPFLLISWSTIKRMGRTLEKQGLQNNRGTEDEEEDEEEEDADDHGDHDEHGDDDEEEGGEDEEVREEETVRVESAEDKRKRLQKFLLE